LVAAPLRYVFSGAVPHLVALYDIWSIDRPAREVV